MWLPFLKEISLHLDELFNGIPKLHIVFSTALTVIGVRLFLTKIHYRQVTSREYWIQWKRSIFSILRRIPWVKAEIDKNMSSIRKDINDSIHGNLKKCDYMSTLPDNGLPVNEVVNQIRSKMQGGEYEWKEGRISGGVFSGNDEKYSNFLIEMYSAFPWDNPLHSDLFPGVRKMEAEIIRMTASLFNGDENVVGSMSSGGSESLLLMMKAYRDYAVHYKGITKPEMIASKTIHATVLKGGEWFGIQVKLVNVDNISQKLTSEDVKPYINSNTIGIVASAPDFAHGIIDDIEGLGSLAADKDILLHVDCCLGGFILPFMEHAGYKLPPFDFRVPGVTSISADTHKYGNAPKGTSVLLYRNKDYLHHQYFVTPDWPGGIYATPSFPGSRAGCNIAMCWGAMVYHGINGYVEKTKKIIESASYLKEQFSSIPELFLIGDPLGPVVAIGSKKINIYQVSDQLNEMGWHLQSLQNPPGIHIFLTSLHAHQHIIEKLVMDLRAAIEKLRNQPLRDSDKGLNKIYCMAGSIPDSSIIEDVVKLFLDTSLSTTPIELPTN